MSAFDDFVAERLSRPWPGRGPMEGTPAGKLYEAYRAFCEARTEAPLTGKAFGLALADRFERSKGRASNLYYGITVETRAERAEAGIRSDWSWDSISAIQAGKDQADAEHRARKHADGSKCTHKMPAEVVDGVRATLRAKWAAWEADGTLARQVEETYGPWLRWRPGEPNPSHVIRLAELAREHTDLLARIAEAGPPIARDYTSDAYVKRTSAERRLELVAIETAHYERLLRGDEDAAARKFRVAAESGAYAGELAGDQSSSSDW